MTDISQISFSDQSFQLSPITSRSTSLELDNLLNRIGSALQQVKQTNGMNCDFYSKMANLVRQSQQKVAEVRKQNVEVHRKCLQHIQILLFQQDYSQALIKIDKYKKMELTDIQFQEETIRAGNHALKINMNNGKLNDLTFEQEKNIINNQFVEFDVKQKIWLQYAFQNQSETKVDQEEYQFSHVSYEQVQEAMLEHFRKQFDIVSQITETREPMITYNLATPEKKNCKSVSFLKSDFKRHKNSNVNLQVFPKENQKSAKKLISSKKQRSSQKRTTRKKANKQPQQSKTSKKLAPFIA